jgi:hypothetical protein
VAHDIAQRRFVIDTHKILRHPDFEKMMSDIDRKHMLESLKKWNEQIAADSVIPLDPWTDRLRRYRINANVAILGYSVSTMAQQPFAIFDGASRTGWANMRRAAKSFLWDYKNTVEFAFQNSIELPFRGDSWNREVSVSRSRLSPEQRKDAWNQRGMGWIATLDMVAATLTWQSAFIQGLNDIAETKGNTQAAVDYADRIVKTTQGAATPKDRSRLMFSQDEVVKGLTVFHTFFNSRLNNFAEILSKQPAWRGNADGPSIMNAVFWTLIIQPLLINLALTRTPDEDTDEPETWLKWGAWSIAMDVLNVFPVAGDVVGGVARGFGFQIHPAARVMEDAVKGVMSTPKIFDDDNRNIVERLKPVADIGGAYLMSQGYAGVIQARRELQVLGKLLDGDYDLHDPGEIINDMMFGPNRRR